MTQRPTDEELRNRELSVSDPYETHGLVDDIPDGVTLVDIISTYRYSKYPDVKARCAVCGRDRHRDGFLASLSNGAVVMLGSKCGQDQFGVAWSNAERDLEELKRRKFQLERLDSSMPFLDELLDAGRGLRRAARMLDDRHRGFVSAFPDLVYELRRMEGGNLTEDVRVSGSAAAMAGARGATSTTQVIGQFRGRSFIEEFQHERQLENGITAIYQWRELGTGDTRHQSTAIIARRRQGFEEAMRIVPDSIGRYDAAGAFLDAANLAEIVRWSNRVQKTGELYTLSAGVMRSDRGRELHLLPLPAINRDALDVVDRLREAWS